jgi:hypothetical protein
MRRASPISKLSGPPVEESSEAAHLAGRKTGEGTALTHGMARLTTPVAVDARRTAYEEGSMTGRTMLEVGLSMKKANLEVLHRSDVSTRGPQQAVLVICRRKSPDEAANELGIRVTDTSTLKLRPKDTEAGQGIHSSLVDLKGKVGILVFEVGNGHL